MEDETRRRFLRNAVCLTAGGGLVGSAIPFVSSLQVREHTKANYYIDIDVTSLEYAKPTTFILGMLRIVAVKRTDEELELLSEPNEHLLDPQSEFSVQPVAAKNWHRSILPEIFISTQYCTHLGCSVTQHSPKQMAMRYVEGVYQRGGYFWPCHGSQYDLAGRVYKFGPAPRNLDIPHHEYVEDNVARVYGYEKS